MVQQSKAQTLTDSAVRREISNIQNPLQRLMTLEPRVYTYNRSEYRDIRFPEGVQMGFFPENVEQSFPELVSYRNYNYIAGKNMYRTAKIKTVNVENLIPILVGAIQQQQKELDEIREQLRLLKSK